MTARTVLASHGVRGNRRILVIRDRRQQRTVVEWYVRGKPRRKSWPGTREAEREAKAWALAWYQHPPTTERRWTIRDIWQAYWVARRDALRPRTQALYRQRFARAELVLGRDTPAEAVTLHDMDRLWAALLKSATNPTGIAPNQVKNVVTTLKVVWNWAESRELVTRNRVGAYTTPTGAQHAARTIDEYRTEDADRILAQLSPQRGAEWRASCLTIVLAEHGLRTNAALHLTWADVDLTTGTLTLRPEWDKMKKQWDRPLTFAAYAALLTARHWRERLGYGGPWVFFAGNYQTCARAGREDRPLTYQALHTALRKAEQRAGVPHRPYRAMHGFRRMAAGNARAATGDPVLGMLWIGDTDLKQAPKYIKEREDELQALADRPGTE